MSLCSEVLTVLRGKSLVTAESCTGGGIGAALTAVPGSSAVYKGGVISYSNWVKEHVLGVSAELLDQWGAVSAPVAQAMADGVRNFLQSDISVSVTGLAGPGGDEHGHDVGTVYIGCSTEKYTTVKEYHFFGDRDAVRNQAVKAALRLVLDCCQQKE